jgi:hypothetical protein
MDAYTRSPAGRACRDRRARSVGGRSRPCPPLAAGYLVAIALVAGLILVPTAWGLAQAFRGVFGNDLEVAGCGSSGLGSGAEFVAEVFDGSDQRPNFVLLAIEVEHLDQLLAYLQESSALRCGEG